jgi:hypothetical protein
MSNTRTFGIQAAGPRSYLATAFARRKSRGSDFDAAIPLMAKLLIVTSRCRFSRAAKVGIERMPTKYLILNRPLVGAAGFEPTTCSTQNCRATRLRYTPIFRKDLVDTRLKTHQQGGMHEARPPEHCAKIPSDNKMITRCLGTKSGPFGWLVYLPLNSG